jgi:hypothetical protein
MNAGWKIVLLSAAVFAVAFGAERMFVPDVAPVGFAEGPQPPWPLEIAFVLRAIELMATGAAVVALVLRFGAWTKDRLSRRAL